MEAAGDEVRPSEDQQYPACARPRDEATGGLRIPSADEVDPDAPVGDDAGEQDYRNAHHGGEDAEPDEPGDHDPCRSNRSQRQEHFGDQPDNGHTQPDQHRRKPEKPNQPHVPARRLGSLFGLPPCVDPESVAGDHLRSEK